ncbi:WD repeat-containing protein 49-like isoform X1 [Lytechinus variegatus]|uniref:WD repeat-containing protein 49-like isoform X1 n=1 Tax=Lytechinus variegatus TaxID=7654 RepID=UPI001BB2B815|nr:WD repeat-containing protein 49-like isoform X1 [Lytechinus variegatus]
MEMESTPENKSIKSIDRGLPEEKVVSSLASASGVVTFGVKIENTLNIQDLQAIKDEFMRYDEKEGVNKEEFCNLMDNILTKGTRNEYAELFDNIDVTKEGFVNWDKFTGHLLLEYVEKDDRVKSTQVPQWKDIKQLPSAHKDIVQKISYIKNTSRYIIISKEGCISTFDSHLRTHKSIKITNDSVKPRDVWVTTFVVLQNINKIALSFTSKEIVFYDLSSKLEFNVQYRVYGLEHTPLSMDHWSNPDNSNEAILVMGDTGGNVNAFHFTSTNIALFDRPQQPGGEGQEQVVNVNFKHLLKDRFKYCRLIRHNGHTEWAKQVKYAQHLNCFISCSTTYQNAMVLGWIEKAKSKMKTNSFNISQGVNAFAYHNGLNLIATAGVDHHVCLWNPYVVSKAVGLLRGHMAPVVHVQFNFTRGQLISFSKDKVLRIWDVQLQVCLQRMAGMFPKGTEMYTSLFFHEASNRLLTSFNYQLTMLEMKPEVKDRVMSHDKPISMALYNSTFNQVVSACHGSTVIVWMLDTGQKAKQFLNCHGNAEITCLAFDHNETRIFTGSSDGTVKVWDFNGHCHHLLNAGMGNSVDISQIAVLKRSLVVIGWDRYITLFRNQQINQYMVEPSEWKGGKEHQDDILAAAFIAPHTLATGSYDGEIVIWNTGSEVSSRHLQQRFHKKAKSREKTKLSLHNESTAPPGVSRQRSSIHSVHSAHHPCRASVSTARLGVKGTEATKRPTSGSSQGSESDEMNNFVIKQLLFLEARKHLSASGGANLVSCGGNGWVRFWNANKNALMAEFIAHQHVGSIVMAVSSNNHYLVTGDSEGAIKVWKIQDYCLHKPDRLMTEPPAMLSSWHLHADAVNHLSMCERNERWLIISASADSSVQLADIYGNHIGTFGQEDHWKIEPYIPPPEPTPSEMDEMSDDESSQDVTDVEDKKSEEEMEIDVHVNFDPLEKVNTWETTRLGKQYQEVRKNKRERKQPGTIPDLPYLTWEKTNQPPAGPYASTDKLRPPMWTQALDVSELDKVGTLQKPDFISHPHKYFRTHEEAEALARNQLEKNSSPELKQRFDERSLFPKYILDHEAEMKLRHRFLLEGQNSHSKTKRSSSRVWNALSSTTSVGQKNPRPFRLSPLQEIVRKRSAEKQAQNQSNGNAT